ncbi:AAA family ATPase [bacterium]|nr:AAA family ATPase [bacterium]
MCRALEDGLGVEEVNKTLVSVFQRPAREAASGQGGRRPKRPTLRNRKPVTYTTAPKGNYELKKRELPRPIKNGAVELLRVAFNEGENVRIVMSTLEDNENGRPANEGTTLDREWWLERLIKLGGNLDSYDKKGGIFIGINPMTVKGCRDEHVTKFRHVLVEFDSIETLEEQWHLVNEAKLPCTAIITSGNKSLHAWVRVDAKNLAEYEQRRKLLFDHLEDHVDSKNANPGRLSRLPNSMRFDSRQELLALNVGAKNWQDFEAEIQAEPYAKPFDLEELMNFDPDNDPNNVLGKRWLCKGGSCLFVGQSGIGKSSLAMQMGINWALGLSVFGIASERPLRSLLIQAENDLGDCSEMFQGSANAMGIELGSDTYKELKERFVIVPEKRHTGESFTDAVRIQIAKHKPDLVWFDPLLSFVGDDISRQDVCSRFLRQLLNPIADETGVIWMIMHHTPKPSADPKSKSGWNSTDHSYAGTGSSELTNWARAVTILRSTKNDGEFNLMLAKRGERARATSLDGSRTKLLHLKHSEEGILWEQRADPLTVKPPKKSKEDVAAKRKKAAKKEINDLDGLIAKIVVPMKKTQIVNLAISGDHASYYLANKDWEMIEAKLFKNNDGLFSNSQQKSQQQ